MRWSVVESSFWRFHSENVCGFRQAVLALRLTCTPD
jgi:hypothetical protein